MEWEFYLFQKHKPWKFQLILTSKVLLQFLDNNPVKQDKVNLLEVTKSLPQVMECLVWARYKLQSVLREIIVLSFGNFLQIIIHSIFLDMLREQIIMGQHLHLLTKLEMTLLEILPKSLHLIALLTMEPGKNQKVTLPTSGA